MEAIIKSRKTFRNLLHSPVFDYELKNSIYDTVSRITVMEKDAQVNTGDIIYLENGFFGVVNTISHDRGKTVLGCNQIVTIFARNIFYSAQSFTYLEDYLLQLITSNFSQCPDAFYAIPYLSARALTHTAAAMNPDTDGGTYSVKSYAAKMRRLYNIFLTWTISRTTLRVDIARKAEIHKNVDFSNPSFKVLAQDFSSVSVSKITSYCEENGQYQTWVLLDDGSIVNTEPELGRVDGDWITLTIQNAADVGDSVRDTFLKNKYSHKIEFQAPKSAGFGLYDRLTIKLDGKVFSSYVSGVTENMRSDIIVVSCGELQMQYPYLDIL